MLHQQQWYLVQEGTELSVQQLPAKVLLQQPTRRIPTKAEHSARELSAEAKHHSWFQQSQQSVYSNSKKFFTSSNFRYKCGCNVQETLRFSGKE
ncbi:hypothetical protein F2Q69_00013176 [Brassica cretica]|uniref:Uncharacterized protein n=1 Tax=Brassica cretica TaxID=69181 RepID=A0A8S9QT62_BRACR|nr:hypothetical protein F2Q69_00013176 [Brassica cretica]